MQHRQYWFQSESQRDSTMKSITYLFFIIILSLLIGFSGCISDDVIRGNSQQISYINATTIIGSGFSSDSGNNTSLINGFNNGYWQGFETNTPWQVYLYFYNVSGKVLYSESVHKYNSTGAVTTHIVSRYIWSPIHDDWIELEEFSNENKWYYYTKTLIDSDRFIYPNGTVIIKYDHPSAGINLHIMNIELSRLVIIGDPIKK